MGWIKQLSLTTFVIMYLVAFGSSVQSSQSIVATMETQHEHQDAYNEQAHDHANDEKIEQNTQLQKANQTHELHEEQGHADEHGEHVHVFTVPLQGVDKFQDLVAGGGSGEIGSFRSRLELFRPLAVPSRRHLASPQDPVLCLKSEAGKHGQYQDHQYPS